MWFPVGIAISLRLPLATWTYHRFGIDSNAVELPTLSWEVAAIAWSLSYLAAYLLVEFPKAYGDDLKGAIGPYIGFMFLGGTIAAFVAVLWIYAQDDGTGVARVGAQFIVVGWLAAIDMLLGFILPERWVAKDVKNDYRRYLKLVDGPGTVAILLLLLFLTYSGGSHDSLSGFASGASAMNLLLVNAIFAVLYFNEGG